VDEPWAPRRGDTGSTLSHLEGGLSGRTYDAERLATLDPADGKPLLARYDLRTAAATVTPGTLSQRRVGGLWRWRELLPVRDWKHVTSLGEGSTPLLRARALGSHYGLGNLFLKSESLNPTGSFKARGIAVAVSRALELGVTRFVMPSAGNAAGALAAYAGAAGVSAMVIMPADAPIANRIEVLVAGADLILLDGLITDCGRLSRLISEQTGAFDLSTLKEPYRIEGKKTMGFELAEDFGWQLPDVVIYPTGGGTGLVGMWKAFDELEALGLIGPERPRMFSVQPEGCAPIVRAFQAGERFAQPWEDARTAAGGMRVPAAVGDFLMLDCLRASRGGAVAIPEQELFRTQRKIGALTGAYLSLESSASVAAIPHLRSLSLLDDSDRVVAFDTGAGLKSPLPTDLPVPDPVPNDPSAWTELVDRRVRTAAPG
jgi:threonine synthase